MIWSGILIPAALLLLPPVGFTFCVCSLKKAGCSPSIIKKAYLSFVRSVLLYCSPVFVNASNYLKQKLLRIETRASRIIGEEIKPNLLTAADQQCVSLFDRILDDDAHPLRELFEERTNHRASRNACALRPPRAKTSRFVSSFIKFCKWVFYR